MSHLGWAKLLHSHRVWALFFGLLVLVANDLFGLHIPTSAIGMAEGLLAVFIGGSSWVEGQHVKASAVVGEPVGSSPAAPAKE